MSLDDLPKSGDPVIKAESITAAESFLRGLCENTFLSLWSYPGVYRDQGKRGAGDGKELCDLLVVFGDHVLIFSDKYCKFPTGKDESVAWKRWFKRAIEDSARQAWGAERWIKEHPERIFLDRNCKNHLPLDLPLPEKAIFHLVVVAHGVSSQIEKVLDDTGSLMIKSGLKGIAAHVEPFTIGDLDPSKTFVHVLDDYSLLTLMKARDTVTDFIEYLQKKESLIRHRPYDFFSVGEEELLGVYLTHMNENGEHDFVFPVKEDVPAPNAIFLGPGPWEKFMGSDERKRQVESNRVSYLWDGLIEKIGYHALTGTQYHSAPDGIKGTEKVARFMASEPRYQRRTLSMSWMNMFENTAPDQRRLRVHLAKEPDEATYIFLLFPSQETTGMSEKSYREVRSGFLHAICMVARKTYPQIRHVVAIATECGIEETRSEDFGYFDGSDWNDEMEKEAASLQKDLQILVKQEPMHVHSSEYPDATKVKRHKRNDPCPCGSGKKYKKCCIDKQTYNW
ncbi:MAG: SEC-C domain-containing protein [Minisyncoccia bacterium]